MYRSLIRLHRASVPQCLGWGTHYRTLWLAYRSNVGSAKLLSFGVLAGLSKEETLALFGGYYRDVLATPDGDDHPNIRNFMKSGWDGVKARSKCPLGQRPSSAPAPPQGAPGSSGQLGTRRKRPTHWALSHRLGCSSEPPPKLPIPPPSHLTTIPPHHYPIPPPSHPSRRELPVGADALTEGGTWTGRREGALRADGQRGGRARRVGADWRR
jgi:hypothetical protein